MKIFLPPFALLRNLESFLRGFDPGDPTVLEFQMHPKWVFVHPAALAFTACLAAVVKENNGEFKGCIQGIRSLPYLIRMGLFNYIDLPLDTSIREHEEAGRFVPLRQLKVATDVDQFVVDFIPLLHLDPDAVEPLRYILTELIWNVLEHAQSTVGAIVCAQYNSSKRKISIGVADAGMGIRASLHRHHFMTSDLQALLTAMKPGISGTSPNLGGGPNNAGAGLFYVKSLAKISIEYMAIYSGRAFYKLRAPSPKANHPILIQAEPAYDPHTVYENMPNWNGTLVGVDFSVAEGYDWNGVLTRIGRHFKIGMEELSQGRNVSKKPRFI